MTLPSRMTLISRRVPKSLGPPAAIKALKAVFTAGILYVPGFKTSPTIFTLMVLLYANVNDMVLLDKGMKLDNLPLICCFKSP